MSQQNGQPLTEAFFDRPVRTVAADLLGCLISHAGVTVRLTEVEAYAGETDPGSHAFRGRTPRTEVMFGPPGGLYVYFTYGMHYCANLVCGPSGLARAVLLRAGEVVAGQELAFARRTSPGVPRTVSTTPPGDVGDSRPAAAPSEPMSKQEQEPVSKHNPMSKQNPKSQPGPMAPRRPLPARDLARGPARLTQALGLDASHNGLLVCSPQSPVRVTSDGPVDPARIRTGPRVGVSGPGGDALAFPWRYWLADEPTVSGYRPGRPRANRRR